MERETVFAARGITKTYRMGETEIHALRGVDLEIAAGEFIVLLERAHKRRATVVATTLKRWSRTGLSRAIGWWFIPPTPSKTVRVRRSVLRDSGARIRAHGRAPRAFRSASRAFR